MLAGRPASWLTNTPPLPIALSGPHAGSGCDTPDVPWQGAGTTTSPMALNN